MKLDWIKDNIDDYDQCTKFMLLAKTLRKLNLASILVDYSIEVEDSDCPCCSMNIARLEVWVIDEDGNNVIDELLHV